MQIYGNCQRMQISREKALEKLTFINKILEEFDSGQDSSFDNNSMFNIKPKK